MYQLFKDVFATMLFAYFIGIGMKKFKNDFVDHIMFIFGITSESKKMTKCEAYGFRAAVLQMIPFIKVDHQESLYKNIITM